MLIMLAIHLVSIFHLVTFDHILNGYGMSAGTDTHYCSVFVQSLHVTLSCETAN